ncbi:MAG: Hpt domain-containing protein [Burkholderiales bacterium]|nr:Hpt domain-containing protein [Burkholderiales bacterium]
MSDDELRRMLAAVSAEFRAGMPARLATIDALWGRILRGDETSTALDELVRALHVIAGSAGTFGAEAFGRAAAAAEAALDPYRDSRQLPNAAAQAEIAQLLEALHQSAGPDAHD